MGGRTATWSMGGLDAIVHGTGARLGLLFASGVLIGTGARLAGGCTSGHGISGTSSLSIASLAATGTFMATAIGVTLLVHALTGGAL